VAALSLAGEIPFYRFCLSLNENVGVSAAQSRQLGLKGLAAQMA
jgi:hypothetical protein